MDKRLIGVTAILGVLWCAVALGQKTETDTKKEGGAKAMAIQKNVEAVLAKAGNNFLTIEIKGRDELVQVAREDVSGKTELHVQVHCPFSGPPEKVFGKAGITIPGGWKQEEFEAETHVQYNVTGTDAKTIAAFVDAVFTKLLKAKPDSFTIEKM